MRTFYHITGAVLLLILPHPVQLCAQVLVKQYCTTTDKGKLYSIVQVYAWRSGMEASP
jgi:hypothetical protein